MSRVVRGTLMAAVAASILNAILYLWTNANGADFSAMMTGSDAPQDVTLIWIIGATIVTIVLGAIVYMIMGQNNSAFLWVAAVVGGLSLLSPYFSAETNGGSMLLGLMHIIAAGAAMLGLSLSSD